MNDTPRKSGRRPAWASFALAALLLAGLHWQRGITYFPFDSGIYWSLATSPNSVPTHDVIRGYFFPELLSGALSLLRMLGLEPMPAFRLTTAAAYAFVLAVVVPDAWRRLAGGHDSVPRRMVPAFLVALVFPGLVLYPLSDLPALALLWICVGAALRAHAAAQESARHALLWSLLAGLAGGAAYNTRTIYLFAMVLVAGALMLLFKPAWRATAAFALGFALVSAPQAFTNHRVHGMWSINPSVAIGDRSLFVNQLVWGLTVQKYETVPGERAPVYDDPAGKALLADMSAKKPVDKVSRYLTGALQHPAAWLGLMGRHMANGLDVRDGDAYLAKSALHDTGRGTFAFGIFLLCAFAIHARLSYGASPTPLARRERMARAALVLALFVPALAILPGAMETRFLLPLQVCLYAGAAASASRQSMARALRAHPLGYALLAVALYAAFSAITQSTIANAQAG